MNEPTPSIALLFDDTALVATLREALHACGVRIVHEGSITGVNPDLLQEMDADVLVINLDDAAADALDRLYAVIDGERPRLVFNDAAASAALDGWDRARWARHLAAKVLQSGDVDPPRPGPPQARDAEGSAAPAADQDQPLAASSPQVDDEAAAAAKAEEAERDRGDTQALSAELEALLASAELADTEGDAAADDAGLLAPDGSSPGRPEPEAASPGMGLDELLDDLGMGEDQAGEVPGQPGESPLVDAPGMGLGELADDLDVAADEAGEAPEPPAEPTVDEPPAVKLDELADELGAAADEAGEAPEPPAESTVAEPPAVGLDELADELGAAADEAGEAPELPAEPTVAEPPGVGLDDLLDDLGAEDDQMKDLQGPPAEPGAAATPAVGLDDLLDSRGAPAEPGDVAPRPPAASSATRLDDKLDGMRLVDEASPGTPASGTAARAGAPKPPPVLPSVPDDWALVDDDALTPATFGVEKQSAAEFLAPEADTMALGDEPVLNLELVSMEEAVAPRPAAAAVEMHLDELQVALSRLVLTGSTLGGSVSAMAFYAALPVDTGMTFLHVQHLRGQSVTELVAQLAAACPLPVALAADGVSTCPGQVLVVPPGYTVRIHRDARVDVQSTGEEEPEASIDDAFTKAAEVFGRDALAIVFSGHNTDSIAGAKALHAAGGRVWVETAANEYADMVHEITAAGVVEYSGTPQELAARLAERPA